jgi:hypothetical protein
MSQTISLRRLESAAAGRAHVSWNSDGLHGRRSIPSMVHCTASRTALEPIQRGLSTTEIWCTRWNIKINEDKTQAIYFSHRLRPPEAHLTLNEQNIPFVNHVKYVGVIFDKRIT